jgi:CheY-like chemotaxis protein
MTQQKRVLIVESGMPVVPFEESVLLRREHEVSRAGSGKEALDRFQAGPCDLAIIDETLSDMPGPELATHLREIEGGRILSILLLGGQPGDAPPRGVNKMLSKPVVRADFHDACGALLSVQARKEARLLVYVQVLGFVHTGFFLCNSMNLSATGILILTARKLKMGETVELQVTLPREREKVRVNGEVTREAREVPTKLNAYGVRFIDLSDEDRKRVRAFVHENMTQAAQG